MSLKFRFRSRKRRQHTWSSGGSVNDKFRLLVAESVGESRAEYDHFLGADGSDRLLRWFFLFHHAEHDRTSLQRLPGEAHLHQVIAWKTRRSRLFSAAPMNRAECESRSDFDVSTFFRIFAVLTTILILTSWDIWIVFKCVLIVQRLRPSIDYFMSLSPTLVTSALKIN